MLEGVPPYAKAYNMKMPGIYAAYAVIMAAFGQTPAGIHLGLLVINAVTIVLVFLLARRIYDPFTGAAAAGFFALLSLSPSVQGIFANAEHFVILPALGGILLLLRAVESGRGGGEGGEGGGGSLFLIGLLLGVAFIMKQHGAFFVAFGGLYLLFGELGRRPVVWSRCVRRCLLFSAAAALPLVLTCTILFYAGVFDRFWFWTFVYPREYLAQTDLSVGLRVLWLRLAIMYGSAAFVWGLATMGLVSILCNKRTRDRSLFPAGFIAASLLSTCPGLYFRPHYFILLLPAIALLGGVGASSVARLFFNARTPAFKKGAAAVLALAAFFHGAYQENDFFFRMGPLEATRKVYGIRPFPETVEVASYIREHSSDNDSIAVIGSEPQIYFYSGRRSATGYIYTYAMLEDHEYALKMQREMAREIESARPEFLVFVNALSSWGVSEWPGGFIFDWFDEYRRKHFDLVGVVHIVSPERTVYRWGEEVSGYPPLSDNRLDIYKRK
ncbi:MAG: glycosyltransferase family 39 protein [Thermodesulfobacteriota bacterium]